MVSGDYSPESRIRQHLKDLRTIISASPLDLPLTRTHERLLEEAFGAPSGAQCFLEPVGGTRGPGGKAHPGSSASRQDARQNGDPHGPRRHPEDHQRLNTRGDRGEVIDALIEDLMPGSPSQPGFNRVDVPDEQQSRNHAQYSDFLLESDRALFHSKHRNCNPL